MQDLLLNNQEPQPEQPLQPELTKPLTDQDKREAISQKFYTLSSAIKISLETLIGITDTSEKHYINIQPYFIVTEKTEKAFMHEMDNVNFQIGMASSVLDSYITFTKSQPDFSKFFNLFYQLQKFTDNHRSSVFYITNARNNNFMYPYTVINRALRKMSFLLSRLCGTLMVAGDYIQDQPPSAPSPYPEGLAGSPYRPEYPYYPSMPYDWRSSIYNPDIARQKPKNQRDIGDVDDKI